MMKTWKRNAVIATVLLFVCVGVYLNWSYNQKDELPELTETLNTEQVMGDSTLVFSDADEPAQAVLAEQAQSTADYFAQVRLSRQQSRDSALELLDVGSNNAEAVDTVAEHVV